MFYERLLPVSTAVLAFLGATLLGMGQRNSLPPLLVFTAAVTSVYFTDIKGWFRLNETAANVGALAATGMALADFATFGADQWLLAIANWLVYLQIVLLYQTKTTRCYWQLLIMSLLHVVVAAVLNVSVLFGFLLIVYLFLALATLGFFFVQRETGRYPVSHEVGRGVPSAAAGEHAGIVRDTSGAGAAELRFLALDARVAARQVTDWGVIRNTTKMVLATVVVSVLIFFSVPRFGASPWQGAGTTTRRLVGFSRDVQLGQLGEVAESPELVMQVRFVDLDTNTPLKVAGDVWLRGSVVTAYDSKLRRWSQDIHAYDKRTRRLAPAPNAPGLVNQDITLEPLSEPVVFCVFPAYAIDRANIWTDMNWGQLLRPESLQEVQVNFRLATSGIRDGRQLPVTPQHEPLPDVRLHKLYQWPVRRADTRHPLAGLTALAAEVLRDADIAASDRIGAAQAMESFLRDSGQFHYTLQAPVRNQPGMDPVEDFVLRRRRGHCEYFASALALMLRSQGIPARVVIGFKGGDWNAWGRFYQIRQLHAHTWVEVFLERPHVENLAPDLGVAGPGGAWLRLDPTPATDGPLVATRRQGLASIRDAWAYAQLLWTHYVVGLNYQKQQESIYTPLARSVADLARGLLDPRTWQARAARLARVVRDSLWTWLAGNWFSWRGGLAAMVFCLTLVGVFQTTRSLWRRWRCYVERRRQRRQREVPEVRFYNRLERLLGRHGMTRRPAATQREFATSAAGRLARLPHGRPVASLPRDIVDAFYRVRFGKKNLDKQETETVERALLTLEIALRETRQERSRTTS